MHAISSYRGNRPTNKQTHPQTHTQTHRQDRLQYTAPQLARMQCNNCTIAYNQRCCPVFVSIIVLDICRHKVLLNLTSIDLSPTLSFFLARLPVTAALTSQSSVSVFVITASLLSVHCYIYTVWSLNVYHLELWTFYLLKIKIRKFNKIN